MLGFPLGSARKHASCPFINLHCMLLMPVGQACLGIIVILTAVVIMFMFCIVTCVNVISSIVGQNISVVTASLVCLTRMHTAIAFSASMCGSSSKSNLSWTPLTCCTFRLLSEPTRSAYLGRHTPVTLSVHVLLVRAYLATYYTTHCVAS